MKAIVQKHRGRQVLAGVLAGSLCLSASVWAAPGSSSSHHAQKKEKEKENANASGSYSVLGNGWWEDTEVFDEETDPGHSVFGNEAYRHDQIASITFTDTLEGAEAGAWDVSEDEDESVLCWAVPAGEMYDLYIGANGKILAPLNCEELFYAFTNVEKIDFNGCFETEDVWNMEAMFELCQSLKEVDVSGFDTSLVTNMALMFEGCSQLEQLDVSGFDTAEVTDFRFMFSDCEQLSELDVSGFDTGSCCDMMGMFASCSSLEQLDVTAFDTSLVTDMRYMFFGLDGLTSLDVSGFDTSNTVNMRDMFGFCKNLVRLDLSGFDTSAAEDLSGMFEGCSRLSELKGNLTAGPDTLTEDMFKYCESLPEELKNIG